MENSADLLMIIATAASATLVAFLFFDEIMDFFGEVREQQVATGYTALSDVYLSMSPQTFLTLKLLLAGCGFLLGFLAVNVIAGALIGAFAFVLPGIMLRKAKNKRVRQVETQLVEGLELLGNSLKSGLTLPQACELLVKEFPPPISQEFQLVLAESRLGVDFNDALTNMANRLNSTIVGILSTGVAITRRCGGDLTVIFQNIATTIREQANIEGKLNAVTAQGRFQGLILSIMPFALIIVLWFIDRAHVETLFGYTIGIWAVGAVVLMVFLAQLWISQLLKLDV